MTQSDFNHLLASVNALSPDQMRRLFRELQSRMTAPAKPPAASQPEAAQAHKPIWEEIEELTASIPDEEFLKLPVDGAEQLDHYIYGLPKRPSSQ